jgi:ribonuclease-3
MNKNIEELDKKLNLNMKNKELLQTALTHRSMTTNNNERLEFLGDAVIELLVSKYLFFRFKNEKEGILTTYRSSMVQTKTLSKIASDMGIGEYLQLAKGEADSGGRERSKILEDTFEALIGAIYLDKGLEYTEQFLYTHLYGVLNDIIENKSYISNKSYLQERLQSEHKQIPRYKIIKEEGPAHSRVFTVQVYINKDPMEIGTGKSKQEAEDEAAKKVIQKLYGKN